MNRLLMHQLYQQVTGARPNHPVHAPVQATFDYIEHPLRRDSPAAIIPTREHSLEQASADGSNNRRSGTSPPAHEPRGPVVYPDIRDWIQKVCKEGRIPVADQVTFTGYIETLSVQHKFSILNSLDEAVDRGILTDLLPGIAIGEAFTLIRLIKEDVARAQKGEQIL